VARIDRLGNVPGGVERAAFLSQPDLDAVPGRLEEGLVAAGAEGDVEPREWPNPDRSRLLVS